MSFSFPKLLSIFIFIAGLHLLAFAQNQPPQISNVQSVRNGNVITLNFDLFDAEGDACELRFRAGAVGGVKLNLNTANATGDLGQGIAPGLGKSVSWDASAYAAIGPNFRIMLIADDGNTVDLQQLVNQVDSARLYNDMVGLEGIRHRATGSTHLANVQQQLRNEFGAHGLEVVSQGFLFGGYQAENIIGRHIGTSDESAYLMIDGHYDSVDDSPGADDNASAVAGVLEALRVLSPYAFEKSIKFVGFDLEEDGLIGSARYVNTRDTAETVEGVFNFEMIGYYSDQPNSQTLPAGFGQIFPTAVNEIAANNYRGDFITVTADLNSTALSAAFANAAQNYVPDLNTIVLDIPVSSSLVPDLRRSDHAAFWNASLPAVMITDGANFRNANYHTANDLVSTLNFRFMRQVVQATVAAVAEMAGIQNATSYWEDTAFPVGLEEGLGCDWEVYPNPAENVLFLRSEACRMEGVQAVLIDSKGTEVHQLEMDLSEEVVALEVDHLAAGTYSLKLRYEDRTEVRKVVLK